MIILSTGKFSAILYIWFFKAQQTSSAVFTDFKLEDLS